MSILGGGALRQIGLFMTTVHNYYLDIYILLLHINIILGKGAKAQWRNKTEVRFPAHTRQMISGDKVSPTFLLGLFFKAHLVLPLAHGTCTCSSFFKLLVQLSIH